MGSNEPVVGSSEVRRLEEPVLDLERIGAQISGISANRRHYSLESDLQLCLGFNVSRVTEREVGGLQRRFDVSLLPSATCPREKVLPIWLGPDFSVVFEGYAGGAEHWLGHQVGRKRSLQGDILRI